MTLLCEILSMPPLKVMTVKCGHLGGFPMSLGLNGGVLAPRHLKVCREGESTISADTFLGNLN